MYMLKKALFLIVQNNSDVPRWMNSWINYDASSIPWNIIRNKTKQTLHTCIGLYESLGNDAEWEKKKKRTVRGFQTASIHVCNIPETKEL